MVKVVHCKKQKYDFYIGRGSILGNPYTHLPLNRTTASFQVSTREEAVDSWERYAWNRMKTDEEFLNAILSCENKIVGCYCHPELCHGDRIDNLIMKWKANRDATK